MKVPHLIGLLFISLGVTSCSVPTQFALERDGEKCLLIHKNKEDREKCFSEVEIEVRARAYEARIVNQLDCVRRSLPKNFHLCGDVPKWEGTVIRPPLTPEGDVK